MKNRYIFGLLILLFCLLFFLDIIMGSVQIPFGEALRIIFRPGTVKGGDEVEAWKSIILLFRLPRALTALSAGFGLSLGGLFMQTLFRNPLAGPSVLGITAGANLGVASVVLILGMSASGQYLHSFPVGMKLMMVLAAIGGAALVLLLILLISRFVGSVAVLLLFGLMCGYLANSLVTLLIHFASAGQIQAYIQWTFGSFGSTTWADIRIFLPLAAACLLPALLFIKPLNAFLLGEEYARSMGVHVMRVRIGLITVTSILAGLVTAYCGPVTFLGVAVPHIARGIVRSSDHRQVLPATLLVGASAALCADLISHMPGRPGVLPLNAITAILGVPVVMWVLGRRKQRSGLV